MAERRKSIPLPGHLSVDGARNRRCIPVKTGPRNADFALEVVVDRGTGYPADGHDTVYYSCVVVPDQAMWYQVAEDIAGGDPLVSFIAHAVSHGRYWDYDDAETTVSWSAPGVRHG